MRPRLRALCLCAALSQRGRTFSATTDASGIAATTAVVEDHGRVVEVVARFAGDATYGASQATATITWGKGPPDNN
jgi:hypothetical protein